MPSPKSGQIKVGWATEKHEKPQLQFCFRGDALMKRDINLLMNHFYITPTLLGTTLLDELKSRGYDLSTLKFSIDKLPEVEQAPGVDNPNQAQADPFYQLPR